MEEVISTYAPDYLQFVSNVFSDLSGYLVGGVIVAMILWTIGYTVSAVLGWIREWTSSGEGGEDK